MYEWKITISNRTTTMIVDIFIYKEIGNDKIVMFEQEAKEFSPYDNIPPTFSLPRILLDPLLNALLELGIKPKEQSFIQGKLEATESHLQDMRKLLKLGK